MLLFIRIPTIDSKSLNPFKYISCYCLSSLKSISLSLHPYSNTSHVIVYLFTICIINCICGFKYISCYCLSISEVGNLCLNTVFKYISCYCLSFWHYPFASGLQIQIHLMLLFITGRIKCPLRPDGIQIHLMLLFILWRKGNWCKFTGFKYISCYCLSKHNRGS